MNVDLFISAELLNLPNLEIERVKFKYIWCKEVGEKSQICPSCNKEVATKTSKYPRQVRELDMSGRKVILHIQVHQYLCDCGRTFSESFDWVSSGKSYTKRQAKYIFEMSAKQSHLQVSYKKRQEV